MRASRQALVRVLPVLCVTVAAGLWIADVQGDSPWIVRNLLPLGVVVALAWLGLARGNGRWTGAGWQYPLGTLGFAIPALGLSAYLHYAYSVNLDGMFTGAGDPLRLFRFLPFYTLTAGAVGFAIGWIVGRNV